jgi:hypothetical protein
MGVSTTPNLARGMLRLTLQWINHHCCVQEMLAALLSFILAGTNSLESGNLAERRDSRLVRR